jgi:hypothetical protein
MNKERKNGSETRLIQPFGQLTQGLLPGPPGGEFNTNKLQVILQGPFGKMIGRHSPRPFKRKDGGKGHGEKIKEIGKHPKTSPPFFLLFIPRIKPGQEKAGAGRQKMDPAGPFEKEKGDQKSQRTAGKREILF